MGKTPKPLRILVDDRLHWKELDDLLMQGHEITKTRFIIEGEEADIVLAPNAWSMDEAHRKYLPLAIREARKRRYPKETD